MIISSWVPSRKGKLACTLSAMFSHRMEQLSVFLLRLLLIAGPFVLNKAYSSATTAAGRNKELTLMEGESLRIYLFCNQDLNTEKVWCKELQKGCLSRNPLIFSEPEWRVLTRAPNEKVRMGNPKRGCAYIFITDVKVEDSGLYWFGLLDGQKIYDLTPVKMVVHKDFSVRRTVSAPTLRTPSFEYPRLVEVTAVQGESLSIERFCGKQQMKTQKVWCKEELLKGCDHNASVQPLGPGWNYLTTEPNQKVIIRDSRIGCVSLFLSDLQSEDSGIYWFGFLDASSIIPFKKVRVIVQGQKNNGNVTEYEDSYPRDRQIALIGSAIAAGILLITIITILVVLMLTKRAGRWSGW